MHKIMSQPITFNSFEHDDFADIDIGGHWFTKDVFEKIISYCEDLRQEYLRIQKELESSSGIKHDVLEHNAYLVWKELIRFIPESWLQTRTVTMTYENLLAMCSKSQRRPHKLNEWSGKRNPELENFIKWARTLPYAQEFIFFDELISPGEFCAKHLREIATKLNHEPTFHHYGIAIAYEDGKIKPINVLMSELAEVLDKKEKI